MEGREGERWGGEEMGGGGCDGDRREGKGMGRRDRMGGGRGDRKDMKKW